MLNLKLAHEREKKKERKQRKKRHEISSKTSKHEQHEKRRTKAFSYFCHKIRNRFGNFLFVSFKIFFADFEVFAKFRNGNSKQTTTTNMNDKKIP